MRIIPIPCLTDNYAYLLINGATAAVVDPSEAAPVEAALEREGVRLLAILCTHHHHDHVGGVPDLLEAHPGLPVYGHHYDQEHQRIPGQTVALRDGEIFTPAELPELTVQALHVPGHTLGAVAFYLRAEKAVFTGDTLFLGGCGRMFEGTPPMMNASLQRLLALPADTEVYCGHEYTQSNLRFAAAVEPDNSAVRARQAQVEALRAANQPTVPATLAEERATNPFLRVDQPAVREVALRKAGEDLAKAADDAAVFGALRHWKDRF